MLRNLLSLSAAFLLAANAHAQAVPTQAGSAQAAGNYEPSYKLPNGRQILAIYIGGQNCGACHSPAVKDAVARMKTMVAAQAQKSGASFATIGVAQDWDEKWQHNSSTPTDDSTVVKP